MAIAIDGLAGAASAAIEAMVARVRPSVVQVQSGGRGAGAGIVWRADGAIVTNHHVVSGRDGAEVQFEDGRTLAAKVTNRNPALDLALLQVAASDLPAALVDDSSALRVGELVFAIGHPWGQRGVVTAGIVSGLGTVRVSRRGDEAAYVRSDVRLAPGNSGGPMLNARGAVVGINAMIFGGDVAVAIPSAVASAWVAGLPSRRVALAVELQPVPLPAAWGRARHRQEAGLMVVGMPRATAHPSLLVGDVLLDVAGEPVSDLDGLTATLGRRATHDRVRLHVLRGGAEQALDVEVGTLEQRA